MSGSKITTHVLDVARGKPAAGISVRLEARRADDTWHEIANGRTNSDGRVGDLVPATTCIESGVYRLTFDTSEYQKSVNGSESGFYPFVPVVFEIKDGTQHYHVPLLLSPFGYSTYRGS